jgi:hypothetical protein
MTRPRRRRRTARTRLRPPRPQVPPAGTAAADRDGRPTGPGTVERAAAASEPAGPPTRGTHAFMYVVDDDARTRRTVRLVFAVTGAAALLLVLLALLAVVLGVTAFAVGGGSAACLALAAATRWLRRASPQLPGR